MKQKTEEQFKKIIIENDTISLKKILKSTIKYSPNFYSRMIYLSSVNYFSDILNILVENNRFIPSESFNDLIEICAEREEDLDTLIYLLKFKEIRPNASFNKAIVTSFLYQNFKATKILWKDERIQKTFKKDDFKMYNEVFNFITKSKIKNF